MSKRIVSIESKQKKEAALELLKKNLSKDYACFVLISCTNPDAKGKMEVEMDFEGEETLAAFLVENAAQVFAERDISRESK